MLRIVHYIILLLLLCCVPACNVAEQGYTYIISLPGQGWSRGQELFFTFHVPDTVRTYRLIGTVRYTARYPYTILPLGMVLEDPERRYYLRPFEVPMQQPLKVTHQQGYNLYQYQFVIDSVAHFGTKGDYTLSYRHLSTDSLLIGLVELGLAVRPNVTTP